MRRPAPPLPETKLPISVLTGFLGSGKTTLLRRVLASPDLSDTAVIVNEFGAIGLDHLLLEAADQEVVTLPNGCVCCAVRQDLADTLYGLLRRRAAATLPPFRRLALETSGLAEPAPILFALSADAFLENALHVDTVVTTIDSLAGETTLDRYAEATAQAACSDCLLLTKTDLASASATLLERLAALNPDATIEDARVVDPASVLFGGAAALPPAKTAMGRPPRRGLVATADHTHGIGSFGIVLRRPMTRLDFAIALGGLARERGEDLLRVKGLVAFADRAGGPAAIHVVQHTMYPPMWLPDWPSDDRTSRLVFIARNLELHTVLDRFAAGDPVAAETTGGE